MSAIKYWLWLSTAANVPPKAKAALLEHYGSPEEMYFAPQGEYKKLLGDRIDGLDTLELRDLDSALHIIDECDSQGISIISCQDALFPDRLKNIYSPPSIIYVKGTLPAVDDEAAVAVIGTRKASPYGLKMGRKMGYEIAKCGGVVVSGLTAGIDAAGAEGALMAGGRVIGVLGVPHEKEKGRLAEDVAQAGALISEYPPGTKPNNAFFRARNRIAAGLSVGVVVVEAPEKSGTRLFANEAAEQGKEIFAVPGNADSANCVGTNGLLKEGAKPVTDGWDVMCEFEALYPAKISRTGNISMPSSKADMPAIYPDEDSRKTEKPENTTKKVIDKRESTAYIDLQTVLEKLNENQIKIVSVMETPSMHVDDIIERSGFSPARVLAELTMLQLKGIVTQEKGKRFTLNVKSNK